MMVLTGTIDDWLFIRIRQAWQDKVRDVIYCNVPRENRNKKTLLLPQTRVQSRGTVMFAFSIRKLSHSCSKQDTL